MENPEDEIRDGYVVTSQMKKVWQIQMDLLQTLLDVCRKHDLKIWAEGGTLLGAIRHKGYIPWDDDIDMMMMRDDYEKLVLISQKEFTGKYFFQSAETEKNYIRGHAQLRRSDTSAILPGDIWQSFNQGIFIDIFVFDYLPKTEKDRKECFKVLEQRRDNLFNWFRGSFLSKNLVSYILSIIKISLKGGYANYYLSMVKDIINYPDKSETEIGDVLWTSHNYERYVREIEWYKDTINMPFESIYIPVPFGYDDILRRQYGDYMKPTKAPSCHGSVIFDTEKSYKEVLGELRKSASLRKKLKYFFSLNRFI